jgi:PHP family Zn ribbon phosphoesterase
LHRVDLHVHTPRSTCYRDMSVTSQQIVAAALRAGLDVIAITDHHAFQGAVEVRAAAPAGGLTVFPGIEITAKEGHFLAIFEADTPRQGLEDFLQWLGIPPDSFGDGHIVVGRDTASVIKEVDGRGGLAIAAHIERWPSGFLESKEPRAVKEAIHANEHLSALEITIPQDKGRWNEGLVRGYTKKYACVQASDAHSLGEIGRRHILLDFEEISLAAFREACRDHEKRILFPDTGIG